MARWLEEMNGSQSLSWFDGSKRPAARWHVIGLTDFSVLVYQFQDDLMTTLNALHAALFAVIHRGTTMGFLHSE